MSKEKEVKKVKEPKKLKVEKSHYAKFIGKKTNDGDKIIEINEKQAKAGAMLEIRTELGRSTIVKAEELNDFIK